MAPHLKIIALGNRQMGDDGIGPVVLERLETHPDFRNTDLIHCGSDMFDLIDHFREASAVYLIDAVEMGYTPGSVNVFDPSDVDFPSHVSLLSLHGFNLGLVYDLAKTIGLLPPILKVVGIEPELIHPEENLSTPVQRAVPVVVDILQNLVCTQTVPS